MKTIAQIKKQKSKIVMVTCYDYAFAAAVDTAAVDMVLVGDSLANVVLGLEDTRKISVSEMINHTRAVAKGVKNALVIADMPYCSYQKNPQQCLYFAEKFIKVGARGVKLEWFAGVLPLIRQLVKNKIPVMGHIGLTPQTAHLLGGYKIQGKDRASALNLVKQAKILEDYGVFSMVVECVPQEIGRLITQSIKVPTIGIGAGKFCRGQVLVLYDLLGLYQRITPKFVRKYADFFTATQTAINQFAGDVRIGKFPSSTESYILKNK